MGDVVIITTYNRQENVRNLVQSIKNIFKGKIIVFDDGSNPPANPDCFSMRYSINHGKKNYYKLVSDAFKYLRTETFERFYMLPDDVLPHDDLFTASLDLWQRISDQRKICLSVGHTHNRHYDPCWTNFKPVQMGEVILTGWNDLCFMAERTFLEELNYDIEQPLPGYDYRSSGVGRYISKKLFPNWNMYHTDISLVDFIDLPTRMHR